MYEFLLVLLASFLVTFASTPWIIPKLKKAHLVGKDVNKPSQPELPEMGGFGIVFGLSAGILLAVALFTFFHSFGNGFNLAYLLAALSTILLMALIGLFDDLFAMHQGIKAILPLFASLPLVAVKAGVTMMTFPFIGPVEFGIFYALILIPIGIAGASNVTNMLAGFNGSEAGMGLVACLSLAFVAFQLGSDEALILLLSMCGALAAFLFYNWYPSKILIGDIGTLTVGAVIASAVIMGNFETLGVIVIIPYILDFFIKVKNRFPSKGWWGQYRDGKLFSPENPISLCQWIMKLTGGIAEKDLVLILILIEFLFGIIAISFVL
ncbi:MAG: hypothetical protein KKB24_00400 [Candidatus Altiarchaeota archaeon]|nr:hypothetical protein [Candidatus Altiarchaeota archaeon]MBU4406026.1 hypothetical protein [Candidatus Altiarchaeota archaeon]MBU4436892.1 hypothetical protein [Candidatus Altiarchaeota archaeon]